MQRKTSAQSLALETVALVSPFAIICALANVAESGKYDGSFRHALT
jgi:hypothetical protein